MRWTIARHHRDVRQPAVSQRCGDDLPAADPFAADQARRARRCDLRQGIAGDDDGAGVNRRYACRSRSRRGHAAAGARRGRRESTNARCSIRARQPYARRGGGARLSRVCIAWRRLSVSRYGRDVPGRRRSARYVARTFGAGAIGSPHLARHGPSLRLRADGARRTSAADTRHPHRRRNPQCDGCVCGLRWIDELDSAPARHRTRSRLTPPDFRGLGSRESASAAARGRPAKWAEESSNRAGVHGGRSA